MIRDDKDPPETWHVDKRVPVPVLFAICLQTATFIWWIATQSTRLDYVEKQVQLSLPLAGQIIRLETKVDVIDKKVDEIKSGMRSR